MVRVSVVDTGKGMPPAVRESLFTYHAISRKVGGTGLGTKIVKDVIDAHHGQITVESEPGVGTSFHITLPVGGKREHARAEGEAAGVDPEETMLDNPNE